MQLEPKGKGKHVKWDQEKLKQTEKHRGTFQKIDEPKTPYRANQESDQQMENQQKTPEEMALEASLIKAKTNSSSYNSKKVNITELNAKLKEDMKKYHLGNNDMQDEEEEQARKKREQFKKKRAQHYNEFKMIQKMKQGGWEEEDD